MTVRASVIVAVYKNVPFLRLVLAGLARQSEQRFEVIVAEDCDSQAVQMFVEEMRGVVPFALKHVSQPDDGFRKCAILNKAIKAAAADYLIFMDGDCIPHRHFVREHLRNAAPRTALYGRRVMLSEGLTQQLIEASEFRWPSLWRLFWSGCQRLDAALFMPFLPSKHGKQTGIWGCNWSIYRQHLLDINGFDEDYVSAGIGEDTDLEWRLRAVGVSLVYRKFSLVQLHLWHRAHYHDTSANEKLMREKEASGAYLCQNGITKNGSPQ